MGRLTPTGVLPYTHGGGLFHVSPDPLTALHCIRGSVLAGGGGMVTQGGSIFSILSFWVSFSFISSGHLALCVWILLYIFFSLCNNVTFFLLLSLSLFLLHPVSASCWSYFILFSSVGSLSCLAVLFVLLSSVGELAERKTFLNTREMRTTISPECSSVR